MKQHCTNNATKKAAEVADGMRRFGNYEGMAELYRRGCFRHVEDVAFARIALDKFKKPIEVVAAEIDATYEGPRAVKTRCARVYPPS